ncbi:MAG: Fic family protein [Spirochaetales bacterium]|nr:Fic family protein [Spirochaetales bacterium]
MPYLWELSLWPDLFWSEKAIIEPLASVRYKQGRLSHLAQSLLLRDMADIYLEESYSTSFIEGEKLDKDSLRSSIAGRLGLDRAGLPKETRSTDGIVEMLIDAVNNHQSPLTAETLWAWQASLFPTGYSGINRIETGRWRSSQREMQIVSGSMGKEKVHFTAPPSLRLKEEMVQFFRWWNNPPSGLDGIIRAALAHLRFVTIHPFEDGNGRVARALTDRALAQDEGSNKRIYSLSSQILKNKSSYYDILESVQNGGGDVSDWIIWFIDCLSKALDHSEELMAKSRFLEKFHQQLGNYGLNERERKVINKMLEAEPEGFKGGMTNKKYVAITKASPATAKRDLQDLLTKKILQKNEGGGRSVSYSLNRRLAD